MHSVIDELNKLDDALEPNASLTKSQAIHKLDFALWEAEQQVEFAKTVLNRSAKIASFVCAFNLVTLVLPGAFSYLALPIAGTCTYYLVRTVRLLNTLDELDFRSLSHEFTNRLEYAYDQLSQS